MSLIRDSIESILSSLGEDPQREGLLKTPDRVARSLKTLTEGYQQNPKEIIQSALFSDEQDEMVTVGNIEFYSLCEHHLLPFYGTVNVAYLPDGKIIGLSKIARVVDVFAKRLQVQERMTTQIAQALNDGLQPKGVAVVVEAQHLCMQMRGVEKRGATMITSSLLGGFKNNPATRAEFFSMIQKQL